MKLLPRLFDSRVIPSLGFNLRLEFRVYIKLSRHMEIEVAEKGAELLDYSPARSADEVTESCRIKVVASQKYKFSGAASDYPITTETCILIENVLHFFRKVHPFRVPAFHDFIQKHPEE